MTITADEWKKVDEFSLLGGPLVLLARRWGLARGKPVWLGVQLGVSCWAILLILALIEGHLRLVFSLSVIGGHIRLLLVIPLLFVCESAVDPTIRAFLRELVQARVVPVPEVPALIAALERIRGWNESRSVELACFLTAVLLLMLGTHLHLAGVTGSYDPSHALIGSSWTARWYWFVCLTLYRFLLLRWGWRLGLWCFLLLRISRLRLHLVAAHPDRMGGMGYLETVQVHFVPLVLSISAVQSASLAEQLARGEIAFQAIYPYALLTLASCSAVLLIPMFFFVGQLWVDRKSVV